MFKRILVAIDGSPAAARALHAAAELAADQRALLIVLHVIDEFYSKSIRFEAAVVHVDVQAYVDALRQEGFKLLARAEAMARRNGIMYETVMVDSGGKDIAHAILAQVRLLRADLVVLGTHGRRGLRRLLLGSDAENVLREARVPVLMVRDPDEVRRVRPSAAKPRAEGKPARRRIAPATLIESSQ